MAAERRFRAMGSDCHLIVEIGSAAESGASVDVEALADRAVARVAELERRWSRFDPASDVSLVNAAAPRPVAVAPETLELARRAASVAPVTLFAVLQALPRIADAGPQEGYLLESLMAAVAQGSNAGSWKIMEISSPRSLWSSRSGRPTSSRPPSLMLPVTWACAGNRPMMASAVTDFPEPDWPMMPNRSRSSTEKLMPRRAGF